MSKKWFCHGCGINTVDVEEDYEEEFCCGGLANQCGCMGYPTNYVLCEKCDKKLTEE